MTRDEMLTKVARIALAIQRAGPDYLGDVDSLHRDYLELLLLIPEDVRQVRQGAYTETLARMSMAERIPRLGIYGRVHRALRRIFT